MSLKWWKEFYLVVLRNPMPAHCAPSPSQVSKKKKAKKRGCEEAERDCLVIGRESKVRLKRDAAEGDDPLSSS